MRNDISLTLWLIRHGLTPSNETLITIGQSPDEPLSERGEAQAKLLGERLRKEVVFDKVFCSSYKRAHQTLMLAEPKVNGEVITGVKDLREIERGDALGMPIKDLFENEELFGRYKRNGMGFTFPNGESPYDVAHRARTWLDKNLLDSPHTRKDKHLHIGVFSHGMTIKCLLWSFMRWEQTLTGRVDIANTSISKVRIKRGEVFLDGINDSGHISASM
jgi:broad specificity phosphatase PhoE